MSVQRLADELASLREELSSLAGEGVAAAASTSREKLDDASKLLGEVMENIEEIVVREEENVENFISSRPLASVAAAFLAGLAVGFVLRRR
jgi:ElaB/YqjD/DUF883 family membrane-anchored ribosome-binding protein